MSRSVGRLAVGVVLGVSVFGAYDVAAADQQNPGETPARGVVSNMGLCSAYLGQLGVRDDVNHLVKQFGPFLPDGPYDSPGELYRVRARQHPNASAEDECEAR